MKQINPKMAGYYRKMSAVLKVIRFCTLLAFIMFCVYCISFFKDNFTMDNIRYVMKSISLASYDTTPSNTEISIESDDSSNFVMLHNDLAVVSNKECSLYDFAGNKLYNYNYTFSDVAVSSNGSHILAYDTRGKKLSVYGPVSKILDKELDYDIKNAYINDSGYFAVVSAEKTYRSGVIVYDSFNNNPKESESGKKEISRELFRYMSVDKYITSVAINSNASKVYFLAVNSENGSYVTEFTVYDTISGKLLNKTPIYDSLGLKVGITNNGSNIYVLTDSKFICFDKDFNIINTVSHSRTNGKFFKEFEDIFLIASSTGLSGESCTLNGYDYSGNLAFEYSSKQEITDAVYSSDTLYVLLRDRLEIYDFSGSSNDLTLLASLPLDKQYKALRTDSYGRYILIGSKNVIRGSLAVLLEEQLDKQI